jgi:hypothetical protein
LNASVKNLVLVNKLAVPEMQRHGTESPDICCDIVKVSSSGVNEFCQTTNSMV